LALKANHLLDLKAAKNDLVSQLDCPNFPDNLWLDVLANRYNDLDKVFAGYYSLESDHKFTETIGNLDITLLSGSGSSRPSKTVESHGDWSIAFSATKRAIAYVYPHRADELSEYEEFIIGLFAAVRPSSLHFKVLNLDKAIRVRVAKDNRLSLVSFEKFSDLSTRHLIGDSVPVSRNVRGARPGGGTVPICQRYNAGRCTSDSCKYRHVCTACFGRHPARDCRSRKRPESPK
jgi:hypothetical protein